MFQFGRYQKVTADKARRLYLSFWFQSINAEVSASPSTYRQLVCACVCVCAFLFLCLLRFLKVSFPIALLLSTRIEIRRWCGQKLSFKFELKLPHTSHTSWSFETQTGPENVAPMIYVDALEQTCIDHAVALTRNWTALHENRTTQQTLNKLMNIHNTFSACLFLNFHSTGRIFVVAFGCRCVGAGWVSVCVREFSPMNGPNVPMVLLCVLLLCYGLCVLFFTLPILCRWRARSLCVRASCYGKSNFLCISRSHFHCQNLQYNCIVVAFAMAIVAAAAAAIWIHGFSLSLSLFTSTFLVCSSWTPVTFANSRIFFSHFVLRYSVLPSSCVPLYSFIGRTVFRALCLWPCTNAHTHAEKAHTIIAEKKQQRELFLQMRKSHSRTLTTTLTHLQTHAIRLRIQAATRIRIGEYICKWACEQDAKPEEIATQTEIAKLIDGFGQCTLCIGTAIAIAAISYSVFIARCFLLAALCVDVIFGIWFAKKVSDSVRFSIFDLFVIVVNSQYIISKWDVSIM